jgi:hypothetical protein
VSRTTTAQPSASATAAESSQGTPRGATWREEFVPLERITKLNALQVRFRLDPKAVRAYSERTKAGSIPPPIKVGRVHGPNGAPTLYLVDGWHRIEAGALQVQREGIDSTGTGTLVLALVADLTEDGVRWEAARANLSHGVQLKGKEVRVAFRAFIKAGQHRKGRAGLLGYRDIGAELGKDASTILRWMKADFPQVAYRMARGRDDAPAGGLRHLERAPSLAQEQARQAIQAAQQAAQAMPSLSPHERHEVAQALRAALSEAERLGTEAPAELPAVPF